MKNQKTDVKYNPFTIINSIAAKELMKHYTRSEWARILKLAEYVDETNTIVVDNILVDSSELKTILDCSRGYAYAFLRKLILGDILNICIRCIEKKFVRTMVLNPYLAYKYESGLSMVHSFYDITKGIDPMPTKTKSNL